MEQNCLEMNQLPSIIKVVDNRNNMDYSSFFFTEPTHVQLTDFSCSNP